MTIAIGVVGGSWNPNAAQEKPKPGPAPAPATPSVLPRPDLHFPGNGIGEGMDIGEDVGSPVDFSYKPPFRFTGTIDKVIFDLR